MRIAVFGLGYVGTVTAAGLASRRHRVCGVDVDEMKVGLIREGSGVSDFFDPPFVVVGTDRARVKQVLGRLFSFLDRELRYVDVRSAEAIKYACNAFHATKVSFANEMGRIFRQYGVDSREVMEIFCEDKILNISPY